MKLSAYLSPSRHGVYYFRWPLPKIADQPRRPVRLSLRTKCPDKAGDLARYLASCGLLFRDNKTLARLRQDQIKALLSASESLDSYSFTKPAENAATPPEGRSVTLGATLKDFMQEHSPLWSEEMQKKAKSYLAVLLEYFGPNRLMDEITRQDAADLKKVLLALPANRSTRPETRVLSHTEAIAVTGAKKITGKTASNYIDTYCRFWHWAEVHGHAPVKLFEDMKVVKAKQAAPARRSYTPEETKALYVELTENRRGLVKKGDYKWGALLALYTGARLREVAQLDKADIRCEGDIWYIDINGDGEKKSLKTAAAKRRVPIHSELIRL